jgi:hypothetical protein
VRWKTVSRPTRGWIAGTICTAEAPVPITATRSPARSCSWFQRAEWKISPPNVSRPGISGISGSWSGPVAEMMTRAVIGPSLVSTRQPCSASSHAASVASTP